MEKEVGMSSPEVVRSRLDAFRQQRGYLLPHQGALAAALPALQDAYGPFYRTLVQDRHYLSDFEREFVWVVLLSTAREAIGTHHVKLFYDSGATQRHAEAAFRLSAWAAGAPTFAFLHEHWQPHFPAVAAPDAYRRAVAALIAGFEGVPPELAQLALLSAHAARADHWGVEQAIRACYADGIAETGMVEVLSLALWPCGINRFIDACDIWLGLMRSGAVRPSPTFQAWADTPGQEGCPVVPGPAGDASGA